jgi:hypothetical protein
VQQTLGNALSRHAVESGRAWLAGAVWCVGVVGRCGNDHWHSSMAGEARWLGKHGGMAWETMCFGGDIALLPLV